MIVSSLLSFFMPSLMAFHGPYIGGNIGGSFLRGEYKDSGSDAANATTEPKKSQISNLSYVFGGSGGYLHIPEGAKTVFGGEVGIFYPGNRVTKSDLNLSINMRYTMNATLLAGMIMNPRTLFAIRIGTDWHSISLKTPEGIKSKTTQAFAPGAAIMYKVSEHLIASASYTLSSGRKIAGAVQNQSYQPKQHRVLIGISYLF